MRTEPPDLKLLPRNRRQFGRRDHRGAQRAFANKGLPERIPSAVPFGELPDLMIVIGESSTRMHWHLYGYDRDTTPRMDARAARGEITALRGVTCAKPNTGPALEHLLTDCEAAHPEKGSWTLPELLRRVGYRTRLVSNQCDLPRQDCYQVFNGCERRCYLHEVLPPGTANYDEQVLPHVVAAFDGTNDAPTAVFVHLSGAHFPAEGCYPPDVAYMQQYYGVQIDESRYLVHYRVFAENLMPEITVTVKKK